MMAALNSPANIYLPSFFKAPAYTPRVVTFTETTKMPFGIAEMVSLSALSLKSNFTGPVMVS